VGWTADLRDYRPESTSGAMLDAAQPLRGPSRVGAVLRQLRRGRLPKSLGAGAVFLLHDGRIDTLRTTCDNTIEVIEPLADLVRAGGWKLDLLSAERFPSVVLS
jgi:hypothetical protein